MDLIVTKVKIGTYQVQGHFYQLGGACLEISKWKAGQLSKLRIGQVEKRWAREVYRQIKKLTVRESLQTEFLNSACTRYPCLVPHPT